MRITVKMSDGTVVEYVEESRGWGTDAISKLIRTCTDAASSAWRVQHEASLVLNAHIKLKQAA